jgi:SAM-dependent methyltransferase
MLPEDARVEQALAFLTPALRGCTRVLEVGCGRGTVARRLGAAGFQVTAIDVELRDPTPAPNVTFVEGDFLGYQAGPFDAIAFTASLHHIPLDAAISRTAALLVPRGLLVADDFDLDAPDRETLRWYYDLQDLLVAAGLFDGHHYDAPIGDDLLARWRAGHHHEPPLHTGAAMRSAISDRFAIRELHRCAYLYRYISSCVPDDERGAAIAAHVLAIEKQRIAEHVYAPVGLRIVAERV